MDQEAARKKRQEDIEAKRKRLEQMRASRTASVSSGSSSNASSPLPAGKSSSVANAVAAGEAKARIMEQAKAETEDLVKNLLDSHPPGSAHKKASSAAIFDETPQKSKEQEMKEKIENFHTVKSSSIISILPNKPVTYTKGIQTDVSGGAGGGSAVGTGPGMAPLLDDTDSDEDDDFDLSSPPPMFRGNSAIVTGTPSVAESASMTGGAGGEDQEDRSFIPLTEEECKRIQSDKDFLRFLRTSSLYVERALDLSDEHDVVRDYSADDAANSGKDKQKAFTEGSAFEEDAVRGRPVMDLKWSPQIPELFLAAYGAKAASAMHAPHHGHQKPATTTAAGSAAGGSNAAGGSSSSSSESKAHVDDDSPGIICVWSRDLHRRPEFKFTASSPVLTGLFHPHEQHLVVGGCYSGQILLWDMRSGKNLPLQRSSMTGKGHKHPVYAMQFTSSSVSVELVSVSTDGLVCHWDITRLLEPISVSRLFLPSNQSISTGIAGLSLSFSGSAALPLGDSTNTPLNICAMSFGNAAAAAEDDGDGDIGGGGGAAAIGDKAATAHAQDILFGSGSGHLVRTPLPYKPGGKGVHKLDAHYGLITAVQPHPNQSNKYKNLLLTSSLDWSVKLWNLGSFNSPLFEFNSASYEYVCDVQWSPVHPTVFVTITSGGNVALWNLSKSTTEPLGTVALIKESEVHALSHSHSHHHTHGSSGKTSTAGSSGAASATAAGAAGAAGGGSGHDHAGHGSAGAHSSSGSHHTTHAAGTGAGLHYGAALTKVAWAQDGSAVLIGDSYGKLHWMKLHPSHSGQINAVDETRFEMAMLSHQLTAAVTGYGEGEAKYGGGKTRRSQSGDSTDYDVSTRTISAEDLMDGSGIGGGSTNSGAGGSSSFDPLRGGALLSRGNSMVQAVGGGSGGGSFISHAPSVRFGRLEALADDDDDDDDDI